MKATLTPRQQEIFDFLKDLILNRGYGPTVREIGAEFGIKSPNGVMCHLKALEKKGLITRESHMSRAIQLTDMPDRDPKLPVPGTVNAGVPVVVDQDCEVEDFGDFFAEGNYAVRCDDSIVVRAADGRNIGVVRRFC